MLPAVRVRSEELAGDPNLDLTDLVENLPSGLKLGYVFAINDRGDMLGSSDQGLSFLLERSGQ